jgi:hypothetical protein
MKEAGATTLVSENRNIAGLLGFLSKAEVDALFQQQPFRTPDGSEPLVMWRKLETNLSLLEPLQDASPRPLPTILNPLAAEIASRVTYKKHYEAVADFSFVDVPIDALLAPQWYADLDYVDELRARLGTTPTPEDIMKFAFADGRIGPPVVTANQVQFLTARRDLHVDPIPVVRQATDGSFEIIIRAASRPNYVQVASIDNRLFLTNGVHKVCALHLSGVKHCPCLLRKASTIQEAGLNPQSTSLFRDAIFKSARPALVRDFLDSRAAAPLLLRSMYQIMQVSINVGAMNVPALPGE